jgi:hypothetical protein
MVQGSLRCIGTGTHLKRTYGKGYRLTLTCPFNETARERIDEYAFVNDMTNLDFWFLC